MKYLCAGLATALLLVVWLYKATSNELTSTKTALAVVVEANKASMAEIVRMEHSLDIAGKAVAGFNEDRTAIIGLRNVVRQTIKETANELFTTWLRSFAPADAWRVLNEADGGHKGDARSSVTAGSSASGLPGNANPDARDKR